MRKFLLLFSFAPGGLALAGPDGTAILVVDPAAHADGPKVSAMGNNGLSTTTSNGKKEDQLRIKAFGVGVSDQVGTFGFGLDLTHLDRSVENEQTAIKIDKTTTMATPSFFYRPNSQLELRLAETFIRTNADNSQLQGNSYKLNANRTIVQATFGDKRRNFGAQLASASKAEKRYDLGNYPLTDRDYLPWQLDLSTTQPVTEALSMRGYLRYSHYDKTVYEQDYSGDVPKYPTLAQVFDYLISIKAGAAFAVNEWLGLTAEAERKAALDTNSYAGDEYAVAYGGRLGVEARPVKKLALGAGWSQSSGKKVHHVQGQSYDYRCQKQTFDGFATFQL